MKALVIDGSTTLGFVMQDEREPQAMNALAAIESGTPTYAPAHWCVEVANGLITAERRKRASQAEITEALNLVRELPVTIDDETCQRVGGEAAALARQYGLTIYDAAYLELAMRLGAALATSDQALIKAAESAGVTILH
jgi:predicted nucleic acid-binding protein